jgi:hypothetical protein
MLGSDVDYDRISWIEEDEVYRCEDYISKGFPMNKVERSLREQLFKETESEEYDLVLENDLGIAFRLEEDSYFEIDFMGVELSKEKRYELHHSIAEGHEGSADSVTKLLMREKNPRKRNAFP